MIPTAHSHKAWPYQGVHVSGKNLLDYKYGISPSACAKRWGRNRDVVEVVLSIARVDASTRKKFVALRKQTYHWRKFRCNANSSCFANRRKHDSLVHPELDLTQYKELLSVLQGLMAGI